MKVYVLIRAMCLMYYSNHDLTCITLMVNNNQYKTMKECEKYRVDSAICVEAPIINYKK